MRIDPLGTMNLSIKFQKTDPSVDISNLLYSKLTFQQNLPYQLGDKLRPITTQHLQSRVVPIAIPVSENASNTAENAGICLGEYTNLCTDPVPCDLLAVKRYPATSQLA